MSIDESLRQLRAARSTTFKQMYESAADKLIPTLSDESLALIFSVSERSEQRPEEIMEELPPVIHAFFGVLQNMKTSKGVFFTGFVAWVRPPVDGILVGFGADDMYYVLAVWDPSGPITWKPEKELYGASVLA